MGKGRNKAPSENTIKMLCGKAAGMCEFEGCGKRLFYDGASRSEFNNAYVAHIVASSQNGPRGDKILSPQLSDKLENLMLMCGDHHKLIDANEDVYTVEVLKEMKHKHEKKIEEMCELLNKPETEIVRFASPIKGSQPAEIDLTTAGKAVLKKYNTSSKDGILINVESSYDYKQMEYWGDCFEQMKDIFYRVIDNSYVQMKKSNFAIFPIAPIPLIIKLGELFGDKLPCDIYQKTRIPDTWEWQSEESTNIFLIERSRKEGGENRSALILSLTNDINDERIDKVGKYSSIYKIKAKNTGVDCIKSIEDLSEFWHKYQNVCEDIINEFGTDAVVDLFPAIPVSAAFEVGRRHMPGVYPKMNIYDECGGFFKTLELGGKESD